MKDWVEKGSSSESSTVERRDGMESWKLCVNLRPSC